MQRPKPDEPLADRVAEFFERQIAWYGCVVDDLASAESKFDEGGLDSLEARRSAYTRDIADQERQLKGLLAEWKAAPKPPSAELQKVRMLARRAEESARRAADALQRASAAAGAKADEVRRNLESLQRGRQAFSGYRLVQLDTGLLDEKA